MNKSDYFEIRPDVLCDVYGATGIHKVREVLAKFLMHENLNNRTVNLYDNFLKRHPEFKIELPDEDEYLKTGSTTSARCKKMVSELWRIHDLDGIVEVHSDNSKSYSRENQYYFYGESETPGEFFQVPQNGVILNQEIEIDRVKYPVSYRFLFAFIFNRTSDPISFLTYHFEEKFQSKLSDYKSFLFIVEKENPELIEPGKRIWNKWIDEVQVPNQLSESAKLFKSLFKSESGWEYVINELSKENPEKWFDEQGNYVRVGRGNDNVQAVCDLFATLNLYQYTDIHKNDFSLNAMNCFGIKVSSKSSNITHRKKSFDQLLSRIKPFNSLKS